MSEWKSLWQMWKRMGDWIEKYSYWLYEDLEIDKGIGTERWTSIRERKWTNEHV